MNYSPHFACALMTIITFSSAFATGNASRLVPEGPAVTVYSSADPAGFNPQQFISQQRHGYNPTYAWQVPGFGVVKEVRTLDLRSGENEIRFTDIAQFIDPTTVSFTDLTNPRGTAVLEQNFEFDLINPEKLYEKYIDRDVQFQVTRHGETVTVQGKVLAVNAGRFVIETPEGIEFIHQGDSRIKLPPLPPSTLVTRPTLVWKLHAEEDGERLVRTTYQTDGLTWRADYHLVLDETETTAELGGWVTLMNLSGTGYENATLKLIAGDVQRVQPQHGGGGLFGGAQRAVRAMPPTTFEQKAFFEYHLYTLPRRTDILANQTQQIMLFPTAHDVSAEKVFVYYGLSQDQSWRFTPHPQTDANLGRQSSSDVDVYVRFRNEAENNLGMPLPRGKVRVYKMDDADETLEFVGEDLIDHTPRDEEILIKVGKAFDVVGERTQTDYTLSSAGRELTESLRIQIRNHKEEAVEVIIRENLFRWLNWEITTASAEYEKIDSRTIHFTVNVPPGDEQTVSYTVQYSW